MRWWVIAMFAACWSSTSPSTSPGPPPPRDASVARSDAVTASLDAAIVTCPTQFKTPAACAVPQAMACSYPQGICFCMSACPGGALVQPATRPSPPSHWECTATPPVTRADGCPGMPPRTGDACTGPKQCSYGSDTTGICWGFTLACSSSGWIEIPQAPPPAAKPR